MKLSWDGAYSLALRKAVTENDGDMQRIYCELANAILARNREAKGIMETMYDFNQRRLQQFH